MKKKNKKIMSLSSDSKSSCRTDFWGSCDTEDWGNYAESAALTRRNRLHF